MLLVGTLTFTFNIEPVRASVAIYIRADGSIDPPTAPISTAENITYTFTDNIYDEIVIERDNIMVDGAGYTIQGTGSGKGIALIGRSNVTIKNMEIKDFEYYGIYLSNSSYNSIDENNITNDYDGIYLESSSANSISENNITANNEIGIWLYSSSGNSISGNNVTNSSIGILLGSSLGNRISGNNITENNGAGIYLGSSSNYNSIDGNNITDNKGPGIYLYYSSNNSISRNNITNNDYGIFLDFSSNYNNIFHNNFVNNNVQVYSSSDSADIWDDGYPSGGNYWSDYTGTDKHCGPNQDEPGSDGIGDTPYVLNGDNPDRYPLMVQYGSLYLYYGWPMFRHDLSHSGYSSSTAPTTNHTLWNYTTGSYVDSSPAVAYGKVYVGSNDYSVYCLDASTGAKLWSYATGAWVILSSPAVADGEVYIGSCDGSVYCLDASTGAKLWSYSTGSEVWSSPAVADGKVYVGSWDGGVYCLDASTGAKLWSDAIGYMVLSSPAVADGKVYVGSMNGGVYCLDASTGSLIWSYATMGRVWSSPAVADGKVYVGSEDGSVYCLDASTGSLIWSYAAGDAVYSSPAVADGIVYVGSSDDNVYALNATTGTLVWNYTTGEIVYSSPAVADGKVYVGSEDGSVYCLDASTGAKLWSYSTGSYVDSSPAVAYGKVYVGSYDHSVYCFGFADDVAVTNVTTSKTGCVPMPTVGQNFTVAVNVTVANVGDYNESAVNVTSYATQTTYYNTTTHSWTSIPPILQTPIAIGSNLVNLDVGQNTTINFTWNTTGFDYGNYTISAYAWPVPNETNTLDNNFTGGVVTVTIPGDINGDLKCALSDLSRLAKAYNTYPGDANWNPNADINGSGVVGLSDLSIMAKHYNQHYP